MTVRVVAKTEVQEGKMEEIKRLYAELVEETRKEEGCILYALHEDTGDPNVLAVIEEWESREHLDRHLKSPHMQRIGPQLKEYKKNPEVRVYRPIL